MGDYSWLGGATWPTTSTNYGPLTTTFTPSSTCLSYPHLRTFDRGGPGYDGLGGDDGTCFKTGGGRPDIYAYNYNTDCYPVPLSASADKDNFWQLSVGYFSPANVCPSAWTTATSSVASGETEVVCCPSQLVLSTRSAGDPLCVLASGSQLPVSGFVSCSADENGEFVSTTVTTNARETTSVYSLNHPAVLLRWKEGDESKTTISTGGGPTPTASPASSHSGTPSSTTAPGTAARVTGSGIISLVLGGASIVAWLLM